MELQNMTKSPKKKRGTQESIFSEELEKSLPLKDVLVLGHHLTTELGFADSCDTLGKWMSHHLAEVLDRIENEEIPDKKADYQHQAVELILKIWKHRSSLNGDAYPLARFKDIISALSILSPKANVWEKNRLGKYESLAADSFSMITDLYKALHFVEFVSLKSAKSKQVPPSVLSNDEQEMYEILTSWVDDSLKFCSDNDPSEEGAEMQFASEKMCDFIDDLCRKLGRLKGELSDQTSEEISMY